MLNKTKEIAKRSVGHTWQIKTAILLLIASGWYVVHQGPIGDADPTRIWIMANTTWKLALAAILFQIGRHDTFPYLRLGLVVQDYRDAMAAQDGSRAQAAAMLATGICILYGWMFATIATVVGKY